MTSESCTAWLLAVGILTQPAVAVSQQGLLVQVWRADAESPVQGAVVRALGVGLMVITDDAGTARLQGLVGPDTLAITALGFEPLRIAVSPEQRTVVARLKPAQVALANLTVSAERRPVTAHVLAGSWVLSREALEAIPIAVEPDPLRALALLPSVSFSSPLSARPILRGYDAAEVLVRLDGFELQNPYHVGRAFSSLPAQSLASASVTPIPAGVATAGTLAGVVDLQGRRGGGPPPLSGGTQASMVSVSGWLASGDPNVFAAPRVAFLEGATELIGEGVPYGFQDVYANSHLRLGRVGSSAWTVFATRDHLGDRTRGAGMDWHNVLLGTRWRFIDPARGSINVSASGNRFSLQGTRIALADDFVDVENRVDRVRVSVRGHYTQDVGELEIGTSIGRRRTTAGLARSGSDRPTIDATTEETELRAYVQGRVTTGKLRAAAGVLLDATSGLAIWQPRTRLVAQVSADVVFAASFARTARSFHILTDPQAEPALSFFEVWQDAGSDDFPVPSVNHAEVSTSATVGAWGVHAAAFGSSGSGIGEPVPATDLTAGDDLYRFGRSRTRGVELRAARAIDLPADISWAMTYVLSWSERNWNGEWLPWQLDRRHQVRLHINAKLGRWGLFSVGEFASGQPYTPVLEVVWRHAPPSSVPEQDLSRVAYRFAREGSGRSAPTFHLSVGTRATLSGPFGLHTTLAASITNLTFGPVAPEEPVPLGELLGPEGRRDAGVPLRRRFGLPAVPSVLIAIRF